MLIEPLHSQVPSLAVSHFREWNNRGCRLFVRSASDQNADNNPYQYAGNVNRLAVACERVITQIAACSHSPRERSTEGNWLNLFTAVVRTRLRSPLPGQRFLKSIYD
jgi:hypothetical protein